MYVVLTYNYYSDYLSRYYSVCVTYAGELQLEAGKTMSQQAGEF